MASEFRRPSIRICLVAALLVAPSARAAELSYSGRLTQANGAPLSGPVDLEVRFFTESTLGAQLGPMLPFPDHPLVHGTFQIPLTLSSSQIDEIFGNADAPWIELKVAGKTRPRQQFHAVPNALRVPTGDSLAWGSDGKLQVDVTKLDLSMVKGSVAVSNDDGGSVTWKVADGGTGDVELTLPTTHGTNTQVLKTNGSGQLYWDDDVTSGGASGTYGTVTADDLLRLKFDDSTYIAIKAPDANGANYTLTLPATAGTNNQVLTTNGSGNLSWTTPTTYAVVGHNHDAAYSPIGHDHNAAYSAVGHNHDATYAPLAHDHNAAYAAISHNHGNSQITDLDAGKLNAGTLHTDRYSAYGDLGAEGKIGTGAAQVAAGNHTHTASDVGLGNVQNTNVLNSFTQNDSQHLATDEIRARDSGGLALRDDGGNGMIILDGGNVGIGTTLPDTILDVNGALSQRGMAAPSTSPSGQGRIYFDSTENKFKVSENGGAFVDLGAGSQTGTVGGGCDGRGNAWGNATGCGTMTCSNAEYPTADGSCGTGYTWRSTGPSRGGTGWNNAACSTFTGTTHYKYYPAGICTKD